MPPILHEGSERDVLLAKGDNFSHRKISKDRRKGRLEPKEPIKPSFGRKCSIMTACLILQFVTVGFGYGLSVLYVEVIRVFESPRSEAALIQSLYFGTMTGGGISMSLCYLGSFITVSWIFHENPGVSLVFLTTGSSLGQVVMPYVIEIFITEFGWSGAYMLLAGIALNCAACGVLIYTSRDFFHKGDNKDMKSTFCDRVCDRALLTDPILLMTLLNVLLLATTGPIEAWFLVDLMVIRGYEREIGSLFVSLTGFANFIGRGVGAILRLFCRVPTVYHWVYLAPVVAVSHLMVVNFYDYWPLFGANLLYGISFGVTVAQEPAIMFEASGLERYPKGIALMNLMYGLGNFIGGLIGGIIKDELGTYDLLFYIAIGASCYVSVATLGIIFAMRKAGKLHKNKENSLEETESVRFVVGQDDLVSSFTDDRRPLLSRRSSSYI